MPSAIRDILGTAAHALRFLGRTPAFTLPAAASLALAIAVNTTLFSVVNATLLRPLGGDGGGDLVRVGRSARGERQFRAVSHEEYAYLRDHASWFADLTGHQVETVLLDGPGGPGVVSAELVAGNYLDVLGAQPVLGRGFTADEGLRPGSAPVLVLSDRLWRRGFGADPGVVGGTVRINTRPFTIAGVAPRGFHGSFPGVEIDVWVPSALAEAIRPRAARNDPPSLMLIGRLAPGVTMAAAEAELELLAARMAADGATRERDRFTVASARGVHPAFAGVLRVFLALLMAMTGVVLLIACANVASLLLARAAARRGEIAVRLSLGASRGRVVAQLLVESVVLALLGGGAGLLLSFWAVRSLNAFTLTNGPTGAPIFFDLRLDGSVLAFTLAVAMTTAIVFGLAPALQATRVDLAAALKQSLPSTGGKGSRWQAALVVAQVALSFVLAVGAVLLFRSMRHAGTASVGFDPDGVVVASFDLELLGYEPSRVQAFYDELLRRTRALPGVERAALAAFVPMGDGGGAVEVTLPASPDTVRVPFNRVSDDYFATVRQPRARGRDFGAADRAGAPLVVIVNETMARRFWPGEEAVGKRIALVGIAGEHEVVGVARDAMYASYGGDIEPFVFLSAPQRAGPRLALHVRTSSPPSDALARIGRLARDIDGDVAPHPMRTMREAMAFTLVPARVARGVLGVASLIALALAAGGLYGLIACTLARRLKEVGVRVALGARRRDLFGVIVGSAVRLAALGIMVGVAIALAATRLLSALIYGLAPTDPRTFAAVAAVLLLVTLGAGHAVARRGVGVDPLIVLRQQ